MIGKLINGTAIDWVSSGHLTLFLGEEREVWWLNVQSGQRKLQAIVFYDLLVASVATRRTSVSEKEILPSLWA